MDKLLRALGGWRLFLWRCVVAAFASGDLDGHGVHDVALVATADFAHGGDYLVLGVDRSGHHAFLSEN